jgi:hypothetical protein
VNAVMNLRVVSNVGNCRVASQLVASRVVLSSIELVSFIYSHSFVQRRFRIEVIVIIVVYLTKYFNMHYEFVIM